MIFPVSSYPDRCVNDCISYISTTDIVSIRCKLVRRNVLCHWQLWHKMSTPDLSSALFIWQWEVEIADPRLKRLVIVLDQVRCKDYYPTKFLQTDEQLAAHRVNGLLRSLCDLGEPLGEQRIGFIDKEDRMISICCMEDRIDIFGTLTMYLAFYICLCGKLDV